MKRVLVNGAGGFIGGHLVKRLKAEGFWVRAVDLKRHEFSDPPADEFIQGDLRDQAFVREVGREIHVVYQPYSRPDKASSLTRVEGPPNGIGGSTTNDTV